MRAREANDSSAAETDELRSRVERLESDLEAQKAHAVELMGAVSTANAEIETLSQAKAAVEETARAKDDEIERYRASIEEKCESSAAELEDARARLDAAESEKGAQHEQLMEMNARVQEHAIM